jgi:ATP-binding cassette subfamily B protein
MEYTKLSSALRPIVQVSFGISFTLSLVLGSSLIERGVITLGDFIAFNTYLGILINPINHIGRLVEVWQRASASIKRLDGIFEAKTDIVEENISFEGRELKGQIEIKNLSFSYPGTSRRALKDINIDLMAGNTLGIIGTTGSGKTTLVNLLLRLFRVESGHVFMDGVDITEIPITILRDNIGCVPQDNFLFSASIKDNIEFFDPNYTDEEVEEASRISSVYENIVEFPDGFDTVVGERGITLSGGQKQRISIARAVIKDPSILVLDDSLSAVDTSTEEEILTNIKSILKGRTGIIIAHRTSTIRYADEIIVMDRGRIIERGSHDELLDKKGEYYKLYCAQTSESKLKSLGEMIG